MSNRMACEVVLRGSWEETSGMTSYDVAASARCDKQFTIVVNGYVRRSMRQYGRSAVELLEDMPMVSAEGMNILHAKKDVKASNTKDSWAGRNCQCHIRTQTLQSAGTRKS
jgi:hypothetical protein